MRCLKAAGIPLASAVPSIVPDDAVGAGGRKIFADPKVQAALKACGITVPTSKPRPGANASPPAQ